MDKSKNQSIRTIEDSSCCYRNISGNTIRLIWEITGRCNLHCHHCFANITNSIDDNNEIGTEEALSIVEQFSKNNIGKVMITGGEPFIRTDLLKILSTIRTLNRDMIIDVTTNATLISEETLVSLKKYRINELSVSFDGCRQVYGKVRETTDSIFEKMVATLKKAISLGIKVDGILVLTRETVSTLHDTLLEAHEIGFSSFSISKLLELPHSNFDYHNLSLNDFEYNKILKKIKEYQNEFAEKMVIRTVGFSACAADHCTNSNIIAINRKGQYLHCLNYYNEQSVFLDSRCNSLKAALKAINGI